MAENVVLEGLALRRAVAEALGYEVEYSRGNRNYIGIYNPNGTLVYGPVNAEFTHLVWKWALQEAGCIPAFDTDLNTLKDAAAMLPDTHKLEVRWYPDETIAIVDVVGSIRWRVNRITVSHTEPATAAWNAVLRWKARKQEAESVK